MRILAKCWAVKVVYFDLWFSPSDLPGQKIPRTRLLVREKLNALERGNETMKRNEMKWKRENQKTHIKTHIKAGCLFEISSGNTYCFSFKYSPRPASPFYFLTLSGNWLISDSQGSKWELSGLRACVCEHACVCWFVYTVPLFLLNASLCITAFMARNSAVCFNATTYTVLSNSSSLCSQHCSSV